MYNQALPVISYKCKYCKKTFSGKYTARKTVCTECKGIQRRKLDKEKRKCINQDHTNK